MNKRKLSVEQSVWIEAWLIVAGSDNCADPKVPPKWADRCLEDFKERFKEELDHE